MRRLLPDLLYRNSRFERGLAVRVDEAAGTIVDVVDADTDPGGDVVERLTGRALIPGFVNAHSHAFQRRIRGHTQWRPADQPEADFWSWREAMYAATLELTPDEVEESARRCFLEMLRAGYTTVGEFHYLQNAPDGTPYDDPTELATRVIAAAKDVGIRIALLNVCYAAAGPNQPLRAEQRRFGTPDLDAFLAATDALHAAHAADPLVSVGAAPHSVRAVPRAWLAPIGEWARARRIPCHMHLGEQPAEVEASLAAWGLRPVALAAAEGLIDERFTAVHATHIDDQEVAALAAAGATVCACPSTERDLGDGFLPSRRLIDAGVPIAIGTDSQTRIDPFDELRTIEYHERLRTQRRVVLAERQGERLEVAPRLLRIGAEGGARALGVDAGRIARGALADLVAIDLDHLELEGWDDAALPALLALCASPAVVAGVWVGGERRVG